MIQDIIAPLPSDLIALDEALLSRWPIPTTPSTADKEGRGHVLVIGGSSEIPGAVILAATAALRAGAGKLTMAVPKGVAQGVAIAMPEARVIPITETRTGAMAVRDVSRLVSLKGKVGAVIVGPGMVDEIATVDFVAKLLPLFYDSAVVLDAYAMSLAIKGKFSQPVILTPHCGEMAHLSGDSKEQILSSPLEYARTAALRWGACIALKGANTYLAQGDGQALQFEGGTPGLAISGSGDTLAGVIGGLAARGVPSFQACAWGIVLHALAGRSLSRRYGTLGYLARELPGEIPRLLHDLHGERSLQ